MKITPKILSIKENWKVTTKKWLFRHAMVLGLKEP